MAGVVLAGAILALGLFLLWRSWHQRQSAGLPAGQVIYSDTSLWQKPPAPLISRRHGLVGRPDYLLSIREKGQEWIIPVEVKSSSRPAIPYDSHILQLAAYCLLVEDQHKKRPPYGLLHYADVTLRIPFSDDLRRQTLEIAAAIRQSRQAPDQPRQHADAARCAHCGYRHGCEQSIQ